MTGLKKILKKESQDDIKGNYQIVGNVEVQIYNFINGDIDQKTYSMPEENRA